MERKLAVILHADVQGYSRLIGEDDEATICTLSAYLQMMTDRVQQHGGHAIGSRGGSLLAGFPSMIAAVQCAVEMQRELQHRNEALPQTRQVAFRMGINLGEVIGEGEQLHGDGINIAVRLEGLAEAGGICISGTIYDHVKNKLGLRYESLGEQRVKNIAEPVRVWRVVLKVPSPLAGEGQGEGAAERARAAKAPILTPSTALRTGFPRKGGRNSKRHSGTAHRNWAIVAVGGLVLIVGTIVTIHYLPFPTLDTQPSTLDTRDEPALPLPDKPSIVVLPFVNMSNDPEQEYFSDGLTEVLTSDLSKFSSLFVIARNSAFTYKGKAVKVQEVGREMGVRYVLEGGVLRSSDQIRITVQLIDAATGHHIWSERYDRPLKDIFALQDEIVQKIVFALKVKLMPEEQERFQRAPTQNLEAYDFYLRGVESLSRFTREGNLQPRPFGDPLDVDLFV